MKLKIYKRSLLFITGFLMFAGANFAQTISSSSSSSSGSNNVQIKDNSLQLRIDDLNINLNLDFNNIEKDLTATANKVGPQLRMHIKGFKKELKANSSADCDMVVSEIGTGSQKIRTYSKSYPIDGNDRIKLTNQYGKITVNTWDKPEIKVDVFIKAEAQDDGTAQRLIDGVRISDGKQGDEVSFKTSIESNNSSWKIWDWGGKKSHKLEIDYTVYMPSKTDLNVDQSYGAIVLPDLQGRVRISSSYGSVSAQNLSNANNVIEGSYGSLNAGNINGAKLVFSYGSVDIGECNTVKAELSYGSFKMDKLKGAADVDLSNVGGFRIGEITNSLKKVNINASYSSVALGLADNNNFDFDITTTYGGFNYNDDKVTVTSKTPPDGATYYSNTKNYKGRFGKGNNNVQMNIHTSYGGVKFE
jgi:hypothetical protein